MASSNETFRLQDSSLSHPHTQANLFFAMSQTDGPYVVGEPTAAMAIESPAPTEGNPTATMARSTAPTEAAEPSTAPTAPTQAAAPSTSPFTEAISEAIATEWWTAPESRIGKTETKYRSDGFWREQEKNGRWEHLKLSKLSWNAKFPS